MSYLNSISLNERVNKEQISLTYTDLFMKSSKERVLRPILEDLVVYFSIVTGISGFLFALWVFPYFCGYFVLVCFLTEKFHLKRANKCRNTGCLAEAVRVNRKMSY